MENNRREFIKKAGFGTAGIAIGGMGFSARSYGSIIGANNRLNIAAIGIRGQGRSHVNGLCNLEDKHNIRLTTLCDVDENVLAERSKEVLEKTGRKTKNEWDMRRVFDDKNIDAVSFATPNHWHALGTIWACQAAKHVYVEKPSCHNVFEGRKMIEAARKYNVCVQVGYSWRFDKNVRLMMQFLHKGGIGEVYLARGLCLKQRNPFGIAPDSKAPDHLHYDMWLGPAAYQPYNEKKLHYNWHWFWNTGGGDTVNQGSHQFDIARWGLNKNYHPSLIYSTGGIFGWGPGECAQETPDTQTSVFKYNDGKILEFETRGRFTNSESSLDIRVGNIFYGTEGYLEVSGDSWKAFRKNEKEPFAGSDIKMNKHSIDLDEIEPYRIGRHENFIHAIRSGDYNMLSCDIMEGHYSSVLPLLANISYRLERQVKFAGEYEKFANDPEADMMLTREYRKPYVVPENV